MLNYLFEKEDYRRKHRTRGSGILGVSKPLVLPTAYPNIIGWLRGGLTTESPTGSWNDSSGNINTAIDYYDNTKSYATQTFGNLSEVSVNGRTCPHFPGSGNNYLRGSIALSKGYMFPGTFTMFIALNNVTSGYIIEGVQSSTSDNGRIWLVINSSLNSTFYAIDNAGNAITCTINEDLTGNGKIVVLQFAGNTLTAYANGNTYTGTNASFTNQSFNGYLSFIGFLFAQATSGYGVFTLADLFVYQDTKTTTIINEIINNYLTPSYNFTWVNV